MCQFPVIVHYACWTLLGPHQVVADNFSTVPNDKFNAKRSKQTFFTCKWPRKLKFLDSLCYSISFGVFQVESSLNKVESKSFVKKMLAVGISNILYLRNIFPESAFANKKYEGMLKMYICIACLFYESSSDEFFHFVRHSCKNT